MNLIAFAIEKTKQIRGAILFYPLTWALNNGYYKIADLLISCGANINHYPMSSNTLLHRAILKSDSRFVKLLVNAGSDVNARNNRGQLPLELALTQIAAAINNSHAVDYTIIQLLINAQANLDLRVSIIADDLQLPLFFYAIQLNLPEAVGLFLNRDATLASKTITIDDGKKQERIWPADFATDFRIIKLISNITDAEDIMKIDPRYFSQEAMLPSYGTFARKNTDDEECDVLINDDSSIETASPQKRPLEREAEEEEEDLDISFDSDESSNSGDGWFSLSKQKSAKTLN